MIGILPSRAVRRVLLAGVACAALVPGASGAEIEAVSSIGAVTVYPDGAIVSRQVAIDLPAGASTLIFKALPISIDPASLRIEGAASGALTLGAVEARLRPADASKPASEHEAELRGLREERDRINAGIDAHEGRKAMIQRFGQTGPERGDKASLDVAQWAGAWEAVGTALAKVNEDLRVARDRLLQTETRIKAIELAETARRSRVAPEREFTVALEAGQPLKGQLTLSYRVGGAAWRPAYDARLTTADGGKAGGLVLTRRALVVQRTGEDWSGVDLTLSTVRAARGTAAPEIDPQRVAFFEPQVAYARPAAVPMAAGNLRTQMAEADQMAKAAPAPARQEAVKLAVAEATIEANGFQASYRIPGKLTVPRDGSEKSFAIQSREIQPELLIKSTPAIDPAAYLEAAFTNSEEAPLLGGDVNLIRDGAYIGRGRLAFTAPGDKVSLGFGADDRVKVTRVPVRRRETEPSLLGSTKSDTREFKTIVRNLHDFAVKAVIIDQMPFSEVANITVEPLPGLTPPTEKIVQDKRGVVGWTYDLQPKEDKEIRFGYKIRWPSDRELTFERAPNPR